MDNRMKENMTRVLNLNIINDSLLKHGVSKEVIEKSNDKIASLREDILELALLKEACKLVDKN